MIIALSGCTKVRSLLHYEIEIQGSLMQGSAAKFLDVRIKLGLNVCWKRNIVSMYTHMDYGCIN